jgi:hypothetical protein
VLADSLATVHKRSTRISSCTDAPHNHAHAWSSFIGWPGGIEATRERALQLAMGRSSSSQL